ncbi:MAG: ABC transporter permease [Candidatus Bathyarchaeota archaeon]|nr:ABC transporter permease [Candidatus Bathyarchaeota archaeon]
MGLKEYIIRRLILVLPTILGAILLVFLITQLFTPEQRAFLYIRSEKDIENIPNYIKIYGLDRSAFEQFGTWLSQVLQGNMGYSRSLEKGPVLQVMLRRWPATIELAIFIAPITILIGIFLGVKSAVHRNKPLDHATRLLSISGYSLPSFWLGIILLSITFALTGTVMVGRVSKTTENTIYNTGLFTRYTGLLTVDGLLNGLINGRPYGYEITLDALIHMILPITVVTTINIAGLIRLTRSTMLEALTKGYIITAKAKGLKMSEVINRHARRNALIPVVTVSGLMVASLMSGLIITETVFSFDGVGRWAAAAATGGERGAPDIASVVGFTFFTAFLFVFSNLIVDILYAYIDPRIRLG